MNQNSEPIACGCGGDWQIEEEKLILMHGNQVLAIGKLADKTLSFDNQVEEHFFLLRNAQLAKH